MNGLQSRRFSRSVSAQQSLAELLEPHIIVERHFAKLGHTYRHGKVHRFVEENFTRPVLRAGLQITGFYDRCKRHALSPVVRRIPMHFRDLPKELDGFQILHLTDFHIDGTEGLAEVLAESLSKLRPDLCVLTGDYRFEDRGPCDEVYPLMRDIVASIRARHGVFGVLGNHDPAEVAFELEEMGVEMLVNESAEIRHRDASLWLVGVDDPFDYQTDDLPKALLEVPQSGFKILLAHAPEIYEAAAGHGIHIYLSGHTHGGQIRLPILGAVRRNAKCPRSCSFGHWHHRGMQGYTSAGVGCSSLPIRINCPPELAIIELRAGQGR